MRDKRMGRILLALDISPRSRAALETAAALAAELDTELVGLFVEDVNLLHLSGLPFTREVGLFSRDSRPLGLEEVERSLSREAEEVQRLLAETAARLQLRWSFHVARGQIGTELFAMADELDLVVLGKRARMGTMSLGDFLAEPLPDVTCHDREPRSVVTVYDGSAAAHRALELAQKMARAGGMALRVLIPAATDEEFTRRESEAGKLPVTAATRRIAPTGLRALAAAARQENAGVLILDGVGGLRSGEGFSMLLNEIDCPVVLVS